MCFSTAKMAERAFKQDLPPKGGYSPIQFKRIPARQLVNGKDNILFIIWFFVFKGDCSHFSAPILFGGFIIWQASALWWYITRTKVRTKNLRIENRGIKLALQPMLLAERDRGYIKQLKLNRDAEEDLMKDVEGWEVGTWFGEPIYKTVRDEL